VEKLRVLLFGLTVLKLIKEGQKLHPAFQKVIFKKVGFFEFLRILV
jgi:hypothetical protein